MTTEPTLAAKVCDHRPLPGGSTLREVLTAANLHAEDMIAEILKAGIALARASHLTDDVRAAVEDAVADALGHAYDCTRTWSAWQHGTMSADDFHPIVADADRVAEIADAAIDAMGVHILPSELSVSDQMSAGEAATVLAKHNAWRRGGNGPALDSKVIGTAIDTAVAILQAHPPLWCLHIIGPDDVYPAPSKEHAEMAVAAYTAILAQDSERTGIRIECVAAPWPHSAESHAKGVGSFITDHLIPAWQEAAHTAEAPSMLMQMIQKASFSSAVDKQAALDLASIMAPVPARPAAPCIDLPAGWKITRDGARLCVKRPDGVVSEWNYRPATNGTGMYDLCMDLIAGAREIPGMDLRPVRSLIACAEELMERTEQPPKANCTCHLAPTCGDCTDWGGLRETRANLQEAIDAAEAAFPGVANG